MNATFTAGVTAVTGAPETWPPNDPECRIFATVFDRWCAMDSVEGNTRARRGARGWRWMTAPSGHCCADGNGDCGGES